MSKKPPEKIIALMKKHQLSRDSLWDCHGTWVLLHKAIERLAAFENVHVDIELIHHNQPEKMCIVKATAKRGDFVCSSFGEAAPYNNKNTYPIAMAEKRAIDRAVLKALHLHGDIYSEIDADEFRKGASAQAERPQRRNGKAAQDTFANMRKAAG